jgi:hypothetical protein
MQVSFSFAPFGSDAAASPEVLALGRRLAPFSPMEFQQTGALQETHLVRAATKGHIGRGGGSVRESFTAQKEHANYWAAIVWTRVTLGTMRGVNGTLTFTADGLPGGSVSLTDAVCVGAAGHVMGMTSIVKFDFVGGTWTTGA